MAMELENIVANTVYIKAREGEKTGVLKLWKFKTLTVMNKWGAIQVF